MFKENIYWQLTTAQRDVMELTKHTDYAFRTLIFLGSNPDELVTIQSISEHFSISKSHLMKIVQRLIADGYIHGVRGRNGGIRLAKEPEVINVGEVLMKMEQTMEPIDCAGQECLILATCRLRNVLAEAQAKYIEHLNGVFLSDLLNRPTVRLLKLSR